MVRERKSRHGRRRGRGLLGTPLDGHDQAGRDERPFRLLVLHGLHGRGSRPRGDHGGRSGPVQLTKRAGQPPLRQARQVPHAGALRQSGMQGFHGRSRGHQRAVRHAGGHPHDHAHLALQVRSRTGRTGILWEAGGAVPRNMEKYNCMCTWARERHYVLEQRLLDLEAFSNEWPGNAIHWGDREYGFIAGGILYEYVRQVSPAPRSSRSACAIPCRKSLSANSRKA